MMGDGAVVGQCMRELGALRGLARPTWGRKYMEAPLSAFRGLVGDFRRFQVLSKP